MMKKIYFLIFTTALLIFINASFSQNDTSYIDNKFKFKIVYTKGSKFINLDSDTSSICILEISNFNQSKMPLLIKASFHDNSYLSILEIKHVLIKVFYKTDYIIDTNFNNLPATYIRGKFKFEIPNSYIHYSYVYVYIIFKDNIIYEIWTIRDYEYFLQEDEDYFKKFLESNFFLL